MKYKKDNVYILSLFKFIKFIICFTFIIWFTSEFRTKFYL